MAEETLSIPHEDVTYRIIGCAMKVHNQLGPGLKERMYQRALSEALKDATAMSHPLIRSGIR